MKKTALLLLALLLLLTVSACKKPIIDLPGIADPVTPEATQSPEPEKPQPSVEPEPVPQEPEYPDFSPVSGDVGEFHVEVVAAEQFEDIDGYDAIRIYYDFTNNSAETASAWDSLTVSVVQEGYRAISTCDNFEDDVPEYGNDGMQVRPGCTLRCIAEYSLNPEGGSVIVSFTDFWEEEPPVEAEFWPQNLPGRPAETFLPAPVEDPLWMADWPDGGFYCGEDYYLYIDSAEYAESDEGERLVRVYFEYTNLTDADQAFNMFANLMAYQDGIQLETGYPGTTLDLDSNYYMDAAPGETLMCTAYFVLRSENPVEIELVDYWGDAQIGCVFIFE